MNLHTLLPQIAFSHAIREPNIEAAFDRFTELAGRSVDYTAFCDAVAACIGDGLIYDPIRLSEGSLQCCWHLELTPKGVAAVRLMAGTVPDTQDVQNCGTLYGDC